MVGGHLNEDASNGPDVNGGAIKRRPQEDLRRPIPKGHHFMSVRSNGETDRSGQTKVCQFDVTLDINQKVLRLKIPMKNSMSMAVRDSLEQLPQIRLDSVFRETRPGYLGIIVQ